MTNKIDTKMIISFLERDERHINASSYYNEENKKYGAGIREPPADAKEKTIYEVAVELEEKYNIISKFVSKYKNDIMAYIAKSKTYAVYHPNERDTSDFDIANYIKGKFIDYLDNRETGYVSKREKETGKASFVDTGQYSNNMIIDVNGTKNISGFN